QALAAGRRGEKASAEPAPPSLGSSLLGEDEHVFVGDQEHPGSGARALFLQLEEARPRHELAAAQAAEQRDEPVVQLEAGIGGERLKLTWQVEQSTVALIRPRRQYGEAPQREKASPTGQWRGE